MSAATELDFLRKIQRLLDEGELESWSDPNFSH